MAIMLYKCGDETEVRGVKCIAGRFEVNQLRQCLDDGWVTDPSKLYEIPTQEEADINDTGKLSNKEVRNAAKIADLPDWETARISRLKDELGYA